MKNSYFLVFTLHNLSVVIRTNKSEKMFTLHVHNSFGNIEMVKTIYVHFTSSQYKIRRKSSLRKMNIKINYIRDVLCRFVPPNEYVCAFVFNYLSLYISLTYLAFTDVFDSITILHQ